MVGRSRTSGPGSVADGTSLFSEQRLFAWHGSQPLQLHVLVNGSRRGEPHAAEPGHGSVRQMGHDTRSRRYTHGDDCGYAPSGRGAPHERDRRALAKPRSVAMNRSSIGTISLTGSVEGWPVSRASTSA